MHISGQPNPAALGGHGDRIGVGKIGTVQGTADVIADLVRMSNFPMGQIPGTGVLDECIGDVRLRWSIAMANLEAECILTRIED